MDREIVKLGVGEERQEESEGTAAEHSGHFIAAEEFWRATSPTKWLYALTDPNNESMKPLRQVDWPPTCA